MLDLKQKAIRGGVAKVIAQTINFAMRIGSLAVLARLLEPRDFGLVGMVTAATGVFGLFRDFGLSAATVQQSEVTKDEVSTLFWANLLIGGFLSVAMLAAAPIIASFYGEPSLAPVTAVLGFGFLLNAAGVQHSALLERQMRFPIIAVINVVSLMASVAVGISMALRGYGYWALVGMSLTQPAASTACLWRATAWIPGRPLKWTRVRSMLKFGGTLTLRGVVTYLGYNVDKVLLGRFWGARTLGLYGRAYQLVNVPTESLNVAIGDVVFSTLSRLRKDPVRLRSYFLNGYSLVLALTVPITAVCAIFSPDLIFLFLGPKWGDSVGIFRFLVPTMLVFALINPLHWLLAALGMVKRSLKVALSCALLLIAGYSLALPYGAEAVALAFSSVMALWAIPHLAWCVHKTDISLGDIWRAACPPLLSGITAGVITFGLYVLYGSELAPASRLALGTAVLFSTYFVMLLVAMRQHALYVELYRGLLGANAS